MNPHISELLDLICQKEEEIEQELRRRRAELHADFEDRRVRFERDLQEQQRRFKIGLLKYLLDSELRIVITAPVIYAVIFRWRFWIFSSACINSSASRSTALRRCGGGIISFSTAFTLPA